MKNIKLLAIILCIAMLLPALVGCNANGNEETTTEATTNAPVAETPTTEAPTTEQPTEAPTEEQTTVEMVDESQFVSFVAYNKETPNTKTLSKTLTLSGKFTVPEGYLEQINVLMGNIGDIIFSLYKWDTDYETTIAGEPIKTTTFLREENRGYEGMGMHNLELTFEKNEVEAGTYLYTLRTVEGSKNYATIYTGTMWTMKKLPAGYEYYTDFGLESFSNGNKSTETPQTSFVYAKPTPKVEVTVEPLPTEKDPAGTAKVILIAGQSNAEGVSHNKFLSENVSPEQYAKYAEGFSNVKIMYNSIVGNNTSDGFVDVKLGQGTSQGHFGPELGLAEYLSEQYPDETFYIIKYAKGGSILDSEWYNAKRGQPLELLLGMTNYVNDALALLEAEGLTPKIVAMLWNQGESDAILLPRSSRYYANLEGMVDYVRTTFADYASAKGIGFIDAGIVGYLWTAYRSVNLQKEAFANTSAINFYIDVLKYPEITPLSEADDLAHYNATSMIKLGHLYAAELAKLLG